MDKLQAQALDLDLRDLQKMLRRDKSGVGGKIKPGRDLIAKALMVQQKLNGLVPRARRERAA